MISHSLVMQIRRIARSGATGRAWSMFNNAGLAMSANAEVLSLKGRLLKDKAAVSAGDEKGKYLGLAKQAYLSAADASASTYPLINAASLSLFAGDLNEARRLAMKVVTLLDSGKHEPETPYWLSATRAEAAFILDAPEEGERWIAHAQSVAPNAWEDHAATVRQVRQILTLKNLSQDILARLVPPPSLFFNGIIGLPDDESEASYKISAILDELAPGAVFGALAAGSDIVVAELAKERGAELHVILPCDIEQFRAVSVLPFGGLWAGRFDALVDQADSLYANTHSAVSDGGIVKSSQIALGLALRRSQLLETRTMELHVCRSSYFEGKTWPQEKASDLDRYVVSLDNSVVPSCPALAKGENRFAVAWRPSGSTTTLPDVPGTLLFDGVNDLTQFIDELLADDSDAAVGVEYRTIDPGAMTDKEFAGAIRLRRSALPGSVTMQWPDAAIFSLLAPEWRFELVGELQTETGDLEIACHFPLR